MVSQHDITLKNVTIYALINSILSLCEMEFLAGQ